MVKPRASGAAVSATAPYYKMDHYGWLADELTELWEQLDAPELKPDAAEVQKLLLSAIEACNFACRDRRKRSETALVELPSVRIGGPPGARRQTYGTQRRKRNRPEVAPGPVPFAIGFA